MCVCVSARARLGFSESGSWLLFENRCLERKAKFLVKCACAIARAFGFFREWFLAVRKSFFGKKNQIACYISVRARERLDFSEKTGVKSKRASVKWVTSRNSPPWGPVLRSLCFVVGKL